MTDASTPCRTAFTQVSSFGIIAARYGAVPHQAVDLLDGQVGDQLAVLIQDSRHVGQQHQAGRPDGGGDGAGHRVGVDVVGRAVLADIRWAR